MKDYKHRANLKTDLELTRKQSIILAVINVALFLWILDQFLKELSK